MARGSNILYDQPTIVREKLYLKKRKELLFPQAVNAYVFTGEDLLWYAEGDQLPAALGLESLKDGQSTETPLRHPLLGFSGAGVVLEGEEEYLFLHFTGKDEPSYSVIGNQGLEGPLLHAHSSINEGQVSVYGMDRKGEMHYTSFSILSPVAKPQWRPLLKENERMLEVFSDGHGILIYLQEVIDQDSKEEKILILYPDGRMKKLPGNDMKSQITNAEKMVFLGDFPVFHLFDEDDKVIDINGNTLYQSEDVILDIAASEDKLVVLERESSKIFSAGKMIHEEKNAFPYRFLEIRGEDILFLREDGKCADLYQLH